MWVSYASVKTHKPTFLAVKTHSLKFQTYMAMLHEYVGFSFCLILMKQATILVTSLIQIDLVALYFEGGDDGYSPFASNRTSQVFTDRTKLQINLYPLENQTWDNNEKNSLKNIKIRNIPTIPNKHMSILFYIPRSDIYQPLSDQN